MEGITSDVSRKFANKGSRVLRSLCYIRNTYELPFIRDEQNTPCAATRDSSEKGEREGRTIESFSCSSSSLRFAVVLSFLASSARLTESVSFLSLSCNLCSMSCLFFA